jgi:phospholipid/cholesterol/gamma-HCH transport system substrate-binding protein
MSINPEYKLPDDTVAEITSPSLLGDKIVSLVPGGSEKNIPPGGQIKYTQSAVSLENLIGQMIFSQPGGQKKPDEGAASGEGGVSGEGGASGGLPQGGAPGAGPRGTMPSAAPPGGLK